MVALLKIISKICHVKPSEIDIDGIWVFTQLYALHPSGYASVSVLILPDVMAIGLVVAHTAKGV